MRRVTYSKTFAGQLIEQIDYGEQQFGARVANQKQRLVLSTIEQILAKTPAIEQPHPRLGLRRYPISRTPFVGLSDFADAE